MENNFNNEEMMNNGFEAINNFGNHKSMTNSQVAAMVILGSIVCAGVIKGIDLLKKRRKEARKQIGVIQHVRCKCIEDTNGKVIYIFRQ